MKNIGILVYDDSLVGGAEKVAKKLKQEFKKIHMISVFQKNAKVNQEETNHYILSSKTKSITLNLISLSRKLRKYLLENEIELLIGITAGVNSIAILATRGTKIKTVYCEHSNLENKTYGKKHELRQYLGAKYMTKVVTLTQRDKNNFEKKYGLKDEQVICIPNWFEEEEENKNTTYLSDSKKIITVGRLEKVKGHNMLIQVAKLLNEKYPDWHWDLYGDGKLKENLQKMIEENNLQNFITLKGNVEHVRKVYKDYAFFVLTSYYEGLPLVLLEAQESKLPIIAFDCPTGPSEIIENNVNGFLIPCYDVLKMYEKLNELIENVDKRVEFSLNSQRNIKNFDKNYILEKWEKLMNEI